MKHVKENNLAHGEFGKWHEERLGISRRMAQMFIKVSEEFEGNTKSVSHLGIAALYQIATLPESEREAIFEIGRRLKRVRENPEKYGFEGYRDWERWCGDELGMTRRYANQFIKVVERFGETGFPSLPQSVTVLNALSSLSDEQLTEEYEFPVSNMTTL